MKQHSIAIDGPSGSGKSTLAKMLATRLGFVYLDTGAIYRAVALFVSQKGKNPESEAETTALISEMGEISFAHIGQEQKIFFGGRDVSKDIRMPAISRLASFVAAYPAVREFLLEKQREFARTCNVVMDGRDIGTVVLPDASLKVFLTATPECRAERRHSELISRGVEASFEQVLSDIIERDGRDMSRAVSPLKQAHDAVVLDSTDLDLGQTLEALIRLAQEKLGIVGEV